VALSSLETFQQHQVIAGSRYARHRGYAPVSGGRAVTQGILGKSINVGIADLKMQFSLLDFAQSVKNFHQKLALILSLISLFKKKRNICFLTALEGSLLNEFETFQKMHS
jgi:hypothetical protein